MTIVNRELPRAAIHARSVSRGAAAATEEVARSVSDSRKRLGMAQTQREQALEKSATDKATRTGAGELQQSTARALVKQTSPVNMTTAVLDEERADLGGELRHVRW